MPGKASLQAGQYYAHDRNTFWKLVAAIAGFDATLSYEERISSLIAARIAVWDVLTLCTRESSLDSDIEDPVPNDFAEFFNAHRAIERVCFNGAEAETLYKAHIVSGVSIPLEYRRLPSTSPANASISFADKLAAWTVGLRGA
jgi:double-stranded uracil-DNA glycosylase